MTKNQPKKETTGYCRKHRSALVVLAAVSAVCLHASAADVAWDGGSSGTGTAWRTAANWNPDGAPTGADNAIFDSAGTVTTCAIDMGAAGGVQQVGLVTLGPNRAANLSIRNLTTSSANGVLRLNGSSGLILSNASGALLTFTNASSGSTPLLGLALGVDGIVYCSGNAYSTAGQITSYSVISEIGGARGLTKIGPGTFYLRGVNTYSGDTVVNEGNLEVDDTGTIGNGAGTLYLSGGNLLAGATRNGTSSGQDALLTPIVITQDAYIQNVAGTATTRYLALAGTISGTGGTLKIANPTTAAGNTFVVRFFNNSINFTRPLVVGEAGYDLASAFSVMELGNTNGTQTFSGDISGVGTVRRLNPFSGSVPAGTSIFSGNNTYSGGTYVSSGTLLANNTVGSALGLGPVLVTNVSLLGGSGAILAPTTVSNNAILSPGATTSSVGNLSISDLTLGPGAVLDWQIASASGSAGIDWDLVTANGGWNDAAGSANPITIKINSMGSIPIGWNPTTARDWVIIQSSVANGFDASHFALDTSAFSGTISGIFALSVSGGSLHLSYTPAADTVINVPAGSVTQGQTSPTPYPILSGTVGVVKVGNGEVVLTNSANDYQGSTKIYAGRASVAVDAMNGAGAFGVANTPILLGYTSGSSNATVNVSVDGVTLGRSVQVQAGSSGTKTLGTTLTSGTAIFTGDVDLQDNLTLSVPAGATGIFSGNYTDAGGLTLTGGGTITLTAVNSYSGPTLLTGGTLNLNAKALGTNTFTISGPSTLDNTGSGSVTLNSAPMNWNANFSFAGTANLNLGAGIVTMSGTRTLNIVSNTLTIGGLVSGNAGLLKTGAGTLAINSPGANSYTGGTTNSAGIISINGTATFGDGTGTLALNGGSILNTGTRSGAPIANPVVMTADTRVYGNSTATPPSTRILPFSGAWTVTGGTLKIGNIGLASNTFELRLTSGQDMTWPVIVGDSGFDTPGALTVFEFYDDNTNPVQTASGLITGTGTVRRGNLVSGMGGTTIFTGNNTYAGGTILSSGALGLGLDSAVSGGVVTSGPLGGGTFEIDNDPSIRIFAVGGPRTLDNNIFLNGVTNTVFTGTNALTFTGSVDAGGVTKTLTVSNTASVTFSGSITNTAPLVKGGPGKLILSGDNSSRTNATTVNAGTLLVNNTIGSGTGSGAVIVNAGGTLGGTGSINGPLTINAGGTLSAGASIGTLTINGDATLGGDVLVEVNTSASPSNDVVMVSGALSNIGTGTVTVANLGPALAAGAKFQLFSQPVANGAAMTISGASVNWTNLLAVDGSIQVLGTANAQPPPGFQPGALSVGAGGIVSLTATGAIGSSYKLWASTNAALRPVTNTWTLISNGTVTTTPFTIQDPAAANFPRRFYIFSAP